jgi:hypothetical protein
MGFIMAAAVAFNVMIGEGQIGRLAARIRHWVVPARLQTAGESSGKDDTSS